MKMLRRVMAVISDLRLAIVLLLLIALASGLGTAIPQGEDRGFYLERYNDHPWLGLIKGGILLRLQLDHVYSSDWFLALLLLLGLALILCSWRRQWPALKAAMGWIDYREPRQLCKLAIAETIQTPAATEDLETLANHLQANGWQVKRHPERLAARRGAIGRVGPLLVHGGLVLLMVGSLWGVLGGTRLERYLTPERSLDLLNLDGSNQLTLTLKSFAVQRDPAGRAEQFNSQLELHEPGQSSGQLKEISVNHPLRFHGMTVYQADWSLAAITIQIGGSPQLQLPLQSFPQLGEQIWGLILPTRPDGTDPVLLTLSNEAGPVQVHDANGDLLANLRPGGAAVDVQGLQLSVINVLPASGLLLKRDPGIPLVYAAFALTLLGGGLSVISTRQLWAVKDPSENALHVGGLCNRNMSGLAHELPGLIAVVQRPSMVSRADGCHD